MESRSRFRLGIVAAIFVALFGTAVGVRADEVPGDGTGCQNYNNTLCGSRTNNQCVRWEPVYYPALNQWVNWCAERVDVQIPVNGPWYSSGP